MPENRGWGAKGSQPGSAFSLTMLAVASGVWIGKLSLLPLNSLYKWDSPGVNQAGTFVPKSSLKFLLLFKYSLKVLPPPHSSSRLLLAMVSERKNSARASDNCVPTCPHVRSPTWLAVSESSHLLPTQMFCSASFNYPYNPPICSLACPPTHLCHCVLTTVLSDLDLGRGVVKSSCTR